jgi:hypothetical protein
VAATRSLSELSARVEQATAAEQCVGIFGLPVEEASHYDISSKVDHCWPSSWHCHSPSKAGGLS